jgi:hypothetical protein
MKILTSILWSSLAAAFLIHAGTPVTAKTLALLPNPLEFPSHTISGKLDYDGDQTGPIYITASYLPGLAMPKGDLYVSIAGSDSSGNGSMLQPFATIQKAIDKATEGQSILVQSGTYAGAGNRELDFKGKTIRLMSASGPEKTLVDCGRKIIARLVNGEGTDTLIKGFTFHNAYKTESADWGKAILLEMKNSSPTIEDCIFRNNEADGTFRSGTTATYLMYSTGGAPVIRNCLVHHNRMKSGDNSTHSSLFGGNFKVIEQCTITDNELEAVMTDWWFFIKKSVLRVFATNAKTKVSGCIVWNNRISEIGARSEIYPRTSPIPEPLFEYTLFEGVKDGVGNLNRDPSMKSAESGYALGDLSPCRDAADPSTELDPDGTRADMGWLSSRFSRKGAISRTVILDFPGGYRIEDLPLGFDYNVTAFLDANGNGIRDENDVFSEYDSNPVHLVTDAREINLVLGDPDVSDDLTISSGLLAWYPFDGNASDMSGNGHHGTVFGATLTEDRNGEHGKAYFFDGSDDFIDLGSNPVFNSFPLTVGVWVKSNGNSGESGVVSKYRAASWNGWQIMEQEDKIVPWYIRSHGQRIIGNYGEPKAFETVLQSPEKWNHLICVFDEDGGRIYLNGSLQETKAWTGDPSAPTASHGLYVGRYQGARSGFYSGKIDDVRIYDRTLNAEEVTALYELEKPVGKNSPTVKAPTVVPTGPGIDYEEKYNDALARLEALKILDKKADADIAQRRLLLAKLDDELSAADKSLQETNVSLAACEKECEVLGADLRAINAAIGVEDAKIYGLNGQIGASEKQFIDLENDKSKLEEDLPEAERKGSVQHTPGWHFIDGKGWLWTSPDYYPLVYSEQVDGWMYYESGSQTPWLYYDYNSETWQEW